MEKDIQKLESARILAWLAILLLCVPNVFSCIVLESVDFWNVMLVMAAPLLVTLLPLCVFIIASSSCIEQEKSFTISTLEIIKIVFLCGFLIYSFFIFDAAIEYNTLDFRLMCTNLRLMYTIVSILSLLFGILFALGAFSKANKCATKKENVKIETEKEIRKLKSARILAWLAIILLCIPCFLHIFIKREYFLGEIIFMTPLILIAALPLLILAIASSICLQQEKSFNLYTLESIKISFICSFSIYLYFIFRYVTYADFYVRLTYIMIVALSSCFEIIFAFIAFSKANACVVKKDNIERETKEEIKKLKSARMLTWLSVLVLCLPGFYSLHFMGEFYWIALLLLGIPTLAMFLPLLIFVKDISIQVKQGDFLTTRKVEKRRIAFLHGFVAYLVVTVYILCATTGMNATLMWIYAIVNVIALPLGMAIALKAFSKIGAQDLSKRKKDI